jgi:hypothetical protein
VSFTAVIENVAEVCSAAIVTVAGTVASVSSLLVRLTTSALVVLPVREMVPVDAGFTALSEKAAGVALNDNAIEGATAPKPLEPGDPMLVAPPGAVKVPRAVPVALV